MIKQISKRERNKLLKEFKNDTGLPEVDDDLYIMWLEMKLIKIK